MFTHEAVRDWEAAAPLLAEGLRKRRAGKAGRSWHVDETYSRSRALVLSLPGDRPRRQPGRRYLSETRDMAAAKAFLRPPVGHPGEPEQVTTDGHTSYPRPSPRSSARTLTTAPASTKTTDRTGSPGHKRTLLPMRGFKNFVRLIASAGPSMRSATSCARPATSTRTFRWHTAEPSMSGVSPRCAT